MEAVRCRWGLPIIFPLLWFPRKVFNPRNPKLRPLPLMNRIITARSLYVQIAMPNFPKGNIFLPTLAAIRYVSPNKIELFFEFLNAYFALMIMKWAQLIIGDCPHVGIICMSSRPVVINDWLNASMIIVRNKPPMAYRTPAHWIRWMPSVPSPNCPLSG